MTDANSNGHRERPRAPTEDTDTVPEHPYRGAAIIHACFATIIVLVAWLTGGGFLKGLAVAAAYFVLATGYSWFQFRRRIRAQERAEQAQGNEGSEQ